MLTGCRLAKAYGDRWAIDGVDIEVEAGQLSMFVGRNGAGKTTTLRILAGLLDPTSGELGGPALGRCIGYAAQELAVYPTISVGAQFAFFETVSAGDRRLGFDEVIEIFDVGALLDRPVQDLSGGQQRTVHVALAALVSDGVLLLDEPTAGLDIDARDRILHGARLLADRDFGVLISTHHFDEVRPLADRAFVLNEGTVVFDGAPAAFIQARSDTGIRIVAAVGQRLPPLEEIVASCGGVEVEHPCEGEAFVRLRPDIELHQVLAHLGASLYSRGFGGSLVVVEPSFENAFRATVGAGSGGDR